MVSQVIATFYLDELDKHIFYNLQCCHYARYMDDFYIIHEDKAYLKYCLEEIKKILDKYKLELNSKTKIYSNKENIEFLGFVFSSKGNNINMRITNKTKKKFKHRLQKRKKEFVNKEIEFINYQSTRASYKGHLRHGNCEGLITKYLR